MCPIIDGIKPKEPSHPRRRALLICVPKPWLVRWGKFAFMDELTLDQGKPREVSNRHALEIDQ
jgi:hypothetical protein